MRLDQISVSPKCKFIKTVPTTRLHKPKEQMCNKCQKIKRHALQPGDKNDTSALCNTR